MEWEGLLFQLVQLLIVTFIPIIGLALRNWIASKAKFEELLTQEALVQSAVEFVEQVYYALDGEEKYAQALSWASEAFGRRGFKVSEEDLKGMIESAVYNLKQGWFDYEDEA